VLDVALGLRPTERAELIEQLYRSFDFPARAEIDAAWADEAEERIDAHERGAIKSVPAARVFRRVDRMKRG
jgi:putative addiction module component (TIGR02574 family)